MHVVENTIFIGVYKTGVYKSDGEGTYWSSRNDNIPNVNVQIIWQFKEDLFVGSDEGIFKLAKNGNSWQTAAIAAQVLSIYEYAGILVTDTSQGTVISKDNGKSWSWIRK